MKIDLLELKAFGCFSNVALDFSGAEHGLYVLYGLNEAGKSIALEGLRQWLYEIDRNAALEFKHKKGKQRVGGIISVNGQRLCCFRKRGNANTLVDENDKPIGDEALRPFLQGIDERRFRTIFGINHHRLREGGEEIAAGKGDLGQALFAAGSGLLRLDRILQRLEEAKGNLFAVRGDTKAINSCLKRCQEIADRLPEERLSLAEVNQSQKALDDLQRNREALKTELSDLERSQNDVERLIHVTPLVQRRGRLLTQLEPIHTAIRLREDFRNDFESIDRNLLLERQSLDGLQRQLKDSKAALDRIASDPAVQGEKDALKQLSKIAGAYETDNKDLPGLQTQRNLSQGEAKQKLRALGREPSLEPENIEPVRCDEQTRNRIRALGTQRAEHFTNAENISIQIGKLELDLRNNQTELDQLAASADIEALAATLKRINKLGDLEKAVKDAQQDLAVHERGLTEKLSSLALWSGRLEQIPFVPIPSAQDIDYHRDHIERARTQREEAKRRVSEYDKRLVEVGTQIERLRQTGDVPSEPDLEVERSRRQRGWRLIRSAWLDGKRDQTAERDWITPLVPDASLAEAYDVAVTRTDQTADRLRREANRVSEQAGLLAEQHATQLKLATAARELQQGEATLRVAEDAWKELWKPTEIEPRSPKEMRSWLDRWQQLEQRASERQTKADDFYLKKQELQNAVADLQSALQSSGESSISLRPTPSLGELVDLTNQRIKDAGDLRQRRRTLEAEVKRITKQHAEACHEFKEAERKKTEWEQQWDAAIRFLGRAQRLLPDEANRDLDAIMDFWRKISDLKGINSRIEGIENRSGGFPRDVTDLAERLEGKKPEGEDPLRVHERLQERLREAESNMNQRQEKEKECNELRGKIDKENQSRQILQQQLQRLCQEAGVEDANQLPEAVRCSDEKRDIETKLQECESDLQLQGRMADLQSLCQLVEESQREQRDYGLESKALEQQIEEKKAALDGVTKQIGAAEEADRALRARSGAGESAAELESEYARLRYQLEEYGSVVLASHVLNEAICRYRTGSSTGLIAEASSIFRLLTCGSFERLAISEEDEGKPYLVGVRPDGPEVGVEGMSDGTCDQLYLALRLAHLKRHVNKEGPFPLIVDDILLTFDNERSRAALRCLADLGRSTQVLFFTHHGHLRDMAEETEFAGQIHIQNLS